MEALPIWIAVFMVCGGVHEFAHAWTAWRLGDDTAERQGRLTLNPMMHVDPFGLGVLVLSSLAGYGFGWMKPVPVGTWNLANPKRDLMLISAAGPISNMVQALVFLLIAQAVGVNPDLWHGSPLEMFFGIAISLNLILAAFNLIPVPPLDGFAVMVGLLNQDASLRFDLFMRRYGPLAFIAVFFLPQYTILPVAHVITAIVYTLAGSSLPRPF